MPLTIDELETLKTIFVNQCKVQANLADITTQDSLFELLTSKRLNRSSRCYGQYYMKEFLEFLSASNGTQACMSDQYLFLLVSDEYKPCVIDEEGIELASTKLRSKLIHCEDRMVIVPVTLVYEDEDTSHSNALIIDRDLRTIELFEPNGSFFYYRCSGEFSDTFIVDLFQKYTPEFKDYEYIAPLDYCPAEGPQSHQKSNRKCQDGGYCLVFSSLYIHLRLLEPDVPREDVIDRVLSYSPSKLLEMILRYLRIWEMILPVKPSRWEFHHEFQYLMSVRPYNPCELVTKIDQHLLFEKKGGWNRTS